MRTSRAVAFFLLLLVATSFGTPETEKASEIAKLLAQGEFDKVVGHFDATLAQTVPAKQLEGGWLAITNPLGGFSKVQQAKQYNLQGKEVVDVTCAFNGGAAMLRVVFGSDGKVGGIWVSPLPVGPSGH